VIGLSLDFQMLNCLGFACYATYNIALYYVPAVQQEYLRHYGQHIPVGFEDVIFASHAFLVTVATLVQCAVLDRGNQRFLSPIGKGVIALGGVAIMGTLAVWSSKSAEGQHALTWVSYLMVLSSVKLVVSLTKYIPQVCVRN
jgi:cystinosin